MKSERIHLTFNKEEMSYLKKASKEQGLPIQIYIHKVLFPEGDLYSNIEKIFKLIQNMKKGDIFSLAKVINTLNITNLSQSDLTFIGKCVKNSSDFLNIKEFKKVNGISQYKKL
jgi:hypothetical protein